MTKKIKSLVQVLTSNILVLILGIITSFIIPKRLNPSEFGYWQVYVLYASYVGLAIFGYCDGIYLKYAGMDYSSLDKKKFSSYFFYLLLFTLIISIIGIFLVSIFVNLYEKKIVFIGVFITLIVQCLNSFFILINQTTARFKIFAIANSLEKIIQVLTLILFILLFKITFIIVIAITLLSKLASLIFYISLSKDLIFSRIIYKKSIFVDIFENIKIGLPLTIVGVISMLLTGVSKIFVENKFTISEFGYFSFSFTVMSLVVQAIISVSIILFPLLKNASSQIIYTFVNIGERIFILITVLILFSFYPILFIVTYFLPNYVESIKYIIILYPLLIFQFKISTIYNTVYKIKRLEKRLLLNGIYTIIFCVSITIINYNITKNISGIAFATLITYFIYYIFNKVSYEKIIGDKIKINYWEFVLVILFILINMKFQILKSFIIFSIICSIILAINYKKLKNSITIIIKSIAK